MSLYGLILGIAFVVCFELFTRKNNIVPKNHEWIFFLGLIFTSVIGARLYHVADTWDYYSQNLLEILNLRAGGLGIFGGVIAGFIYIFIYCYSQKINLLKLTDQIASVLPLGQAIGRFGNFVNHEVYSPGGFPVWALESMLDFALFLFLWKSTHHQTAIYLIGYGLIRFPLEFLRTDTWQIGTIKIGQLISIIFIIVGFLIYAQTKNRSKQHQ